ncbi:cell division protein ZipA [Ningiella sp. W23]|uniref:cell division protein ZipA n=1 Tax=Ningiella sp. W23 TaxID=3023715 RepID=UPI003756DB94
MQEEFRIALFVLGSAFIIGILVHGWWTVRKNKKQSHPNSFQPRSYEPKFGANSERDQDTDDDLYDDVGVGQARVIKTETHAPVSSAEHEEEIISLADEHKREKIVITDADVVDELDDIEVIESEEAVTVSPYPSDEDPSNTAGPAADIENNEAVNESPIADVDSNVSSAPLYSGVVTQPKPEFTKPVKVSASAESDENPVPEPPAFLLKKNEEDLNQSAGSDKQGAEGQQNNTEPPAPDFSLDVQEGPLVDKPDEKANNTEHTEAENKVDDTQSRPEPSEEKEEGFAAQAKRFMRRRKKTVAEKIRKEPSVRGTAKNAEDQMRIDFEEPQVHRNADVTNSDAQSEGLGVSQASESAQQSTKAEEALPDNDVLVLNVRASQDNPISGAALLPMLLTLGFKFGEHDIFHRHVNTNGKGPILFSLTNMFKPGVFDIDNIENFSTRGVSLFMMLPIEGEAQQVFNMMHNAARKLSEEFGCSILDGNKVPLSKQSLQQYSERIRAFERRRLSR